MAFGMILEEQAELATGPAGPLRPRRKGTRFVRSLLGNRKAMAGAILLAIFCLLAAVPGLIAPYSPTSTAFPRGAHPSWAHLLGTTTYGQDVLSQLIWGARQSLVLALLVGALSTALSVVIGISAAFLGGFADGVLSVVTDVLLVIPTFPLIVVIAAFINGANLFLLIIVLVVTGWSFGARLLRSQTLALRKREFLEAARVRGERKLYIIVFEVLPNMASLILASFLSAALYAVLAATSLQFVGLGDPNAISWGTMLYWSQNAEALNIGLPLWALMPGVCVALLGASFALLNYAFDELNNPALRPLRSAHRSRRRRGAR